MRYLAVGSSFQPSVIDTYASSLADGGSVRWAINQTDAPGVYNIVYPDIRWGSIRGTLGWAALQHHSLIHTTLSVELPTSSSLSYPALSIRLNQASYVALIERDEALTESKVQWFEGDIYAQSSITRFLPLPVSYRKKRTIMYDVFISADYEIRLFGDPEYSRGRAEPSTEARLVIDIVDAPQVAIGDRRIFPDFVDGWAMGDGWGLEIQNGPEWQTLMSVESGFKVCHILSYKRPLLM